MPGNIGLKVESVVATINNSAGGATIAKIVIRDSFGAVVATKSQSVTIPAGDTGTATWALRLGGDGDGGSSGGLTVISDTALSTTTSLINVVIPQTFKNLQAEITSRTTHTGSGGIDFMVMQCNNATIADYWTQYDGFNAGNFYPVDYNGYNYAVLGETCGDDAVANAFGSCTVNVYDYQNTGKLKMWKSSAVGLKVLMQDHTISIAGGVFNSLAAITSLQFFSPFGDMKIGTRITVYGY